MVSPTLKRNSLRPKQAFGFCLAALMLIQGVTPASAQVGRKLPKGLLPAPGNVGIVMSLLGPSDARPLVMAKDHPLFESSWVGRSSEVVAQTKYGAITSQDLYLWMILRESPNKAYLLEAYHKTKLPKEREVIARALRAEIDEYVFTNFVIPRIMPAAIPDSIYDFKHHVYTLPAWQTVFLTKVVGPTACITDADRQKYLQENIPTLVEHERLRTRYIFKKAAETDPALDRDQIEQDLISLRTRILTGEIDFATAARQHSQAPSASRGGEIPPFQHGELFFHFENAAANLEPGGISMPFHGPNGFYMVQLVEVLKPEEPSLSNPRHAALIEEGLSRQVLRAAYDMYMRDMLESRRRISDKLAAWNSLEDHEGIGKVCDFEIAKGQFRNAWPAVESNNLKLRTELIAPQLRTILERQAMAQEVQQLGFDNDPMLERARTMAGNIIRRDAWVDQLRASLPVSEQLVQNFWRNHPELFTPLALKRVIRLTMTPSNNAPLPSQTRQELDQVLASAAGEPATVPVARRQFMDEERSAVVYDTLDRTERAFQMMTEPDDMNFYYDQQSTSSLESLINSGSPNDLPSLEGEPAPGLEPIAGPSSVTTDTLETLSSPSTSESSAPVPADKPVTPIIPIPTDDRPSAPETLDLPTTTPQGGAAPGPVAGGNLVDENVLPELLPVSPEPVTNKPSAPPRVEKTPAVGRPYLQPEEMEIGPKIPSHHRSGAPAAKARAGAVPVGVTAPALAPAALLQPTPNVRKQGPPPATSAIPYNPDWFYARLNPTEIKAVVGDYASSDWLLQMDDLGFVYLEDLPEIPRTVERVPVGAFTRPILRGLNAVSWYIEDARTSEKQPFEKIKTHAYDVYRETQIDKTASKTFDSELKKAAIEYKF